MICLPFHPLSRRADEIFDFGEISVPELGDINNGIILTVHLSHARSGVALISVGCIAEDFLPVWTYVRMKEQTPSRPDGMLQLAVEGLFLESSWERL